MNEPEDLELETINVNVREPFESAPPEIRQIIDRVLQLEKSRLDRKSNSHINDDILSIIKQIIQ